MTLPAPLSAFCAIIVAPSPAVLAPTNVMFLSDAPVVTEMTLPLSPLIVV